ncbi:MAG: IS21 family transposase [Gammaproteobacteria bacterium]
MLSPKIQSEILFAYFSEDRSVREIARKFGVNRKSVDRLLTRGRVAIEKSYSNRGSLIDPYMDDLTAMLEKEEGLSIKVLFQRIRSQGFPGSYTLVRESVSGLREKLNKRKSKEAFFTLDFALGQASQIDWGEFEDYFEDGIKLHCFTMVLCYSRLIYVEFTRSERFEDFIRCHENALKYFGGKRTTEFWYDNLPTAVSERKGKLVRFNNRFYAYAGHHRFKPVACNVARGNEKGRVENGVKYVRHNFWPGRTFSSFEDLKNQASQWRDNIANLREHETTKKVPRWVYDEEEFKKLESINPESYETDQVFSNRIRPDYHIVYETNRYSVPWTMVDVIVTVRVDADWIKIFYQNKFVTKHLRSYLKDQRPFTKSEHETGLIEQKPQGKNAHIHWQIDTLNSYGPSVKKYLLTLANSPRSLKSELARLLALGTVYGPKALDEAISEVIKYGVFGADHIERFIKTNDKAKPINPKPLSLQNENLMKTPARVDLQSYDALLFNHNQPKETESGLQKRSEDIGIDQTESIGVETETLGKTD